MAPKLLFEGKRKGKKIKNKRRKKKKKLERADPGSRERCWGE